MCRRGPGLTGGMPCWSSALLTPVCPKHTAWRVGREGGRRREKERGGGKREEGGRGRGKGIKGERGEGKIGGRVLSAGIYLSPQKS